MKPAKTKLGNRSGRMIEIVFAKRFSFPRNALNIALNLAVNSALVFGFAICGATVSRAQDASGPLTPPPEHDVHRVTTNQPVEAPPAKPPAEIVKEFAAKEEKFLRARVGYGYKKSIKLTEYGHEGQPSG